jgi:predicted nucleotide-binding protein (sugar kinase/HSP70/actin superfamily)
VIERLESHGIRTRLAPLSEWIEYTDYLARLPEQNPGLSRRFQSAMQQRILGITAGIFERRMGLECHHPVTSSVEAAAPYLSQDLWGEAVLTLGFPMHEWSKNRIHGIVNLGPLECMPTKIAEAQFFHMTERQKTLAITIPFNGDPLDPQIVENFSYEVHERYRQARQSRANHSR